jgi:hypothetical protein
MTERVLKIIAYAIVAVYMLIGAFIGCQAAATLDQLEKLLK